MLNKACLITAAVLVSLAISLNAAGLCSPTAEYLLGGGLLAIVFRLGKLEGQLHEIKNYLEKLNGKS